MVVLRKAEVKLPLTQKGDISANVESVTISAQSELCKKCRQCELVCPAGVFTWTSDKIEIRRVGLCIKCGHCVAACPEAAIEHAQLAEKKFTTLEAGTSIEPKALRQLFMQRRSCRRFQTDSLSRDEIKALIDEARFAPTPTNSQNVRFIIFDTRDGVKNLTQWVSDYYIKLERQIESPFWRFAASVTIGRKTVDAYRYHMPAIAERFKQTQKGDDRLFYGAPTVIIAFASGVAHQALASCNLTAMQILLAAETLGLGTCYNGYALTALVRNKHIRQKVGISKGYHPGAVIAVGRPAGAFYKVPPRRKRRMIWWD